MERKIGAVDGAKKIEKLLRRIGEMASKRKKQEKKKKKKEGNEMIQRISSLLRRFFNL